MLGTPIRKGDGDSQWQALWHSHHNDGDSKNEELQDLVRLILVEPLVLDQPPATMQSVVSPWQASPLMSSCMTDHKARHQ